MKSLTLLFSVFILFLTGSAFCQNNDDPTMDVGFKPYGSYHGGEIDSINLSNGFLNLHIPIIDYPQRGALSYSAQILYNNHKGWSVFPDCINENTCHPVWQWKGSGVTVDTQSPDFFTAGPGPYVKGSKFIVYTGVTADGASHQMAITPSGNAESIDGSGLWQNGTAFGAPGGFSHNKAGFTNDGFNLEDTNGNLLSFPTTTPTMTDTIGRNIPTTFSPGATDFSGCTGPLPIVSASIINFTGYKGATRSFKACVASVALQSNFNTTGFYNDMQLPIAEGHTTVALLQSLVLYNGTSWTTSPAWTFEYSSRNPSDSTSVNYGDLTKITLPTGGTISYTWGFIGNCDPTATTPLSRRVISRTVDANDGKGPQKWSYNFGIVTDPDNNDTVHTFTGLNFSCSLYETQTQYFQGSFQTGQLLKTVTTDYQWMANPFDNLDGQATPPTVTNVFPIRITTTWPGGKFAKVEKDYDASLVFNVPGKGQFTGSYGFVKEIREFDYGDAKTAPALVRRTDYTYKAFDGSTSASSFLSANMLDRVASVTTFDGGGNKVAQVNYGYDESPLQPSGVSVQRYNPPTNGATRGNLTSESHWLNTSNTFLKATRSYYDTGTPYQITDPGGHTSTNFYGLGFQSQRDFAGTYITQIQDALQHAAFFDYDFTTGLRVGTKDANGGVSSADYDIYGRTIQAASPSGANNSWQYFDIPPVSFTATNSITPTLDRTVEGDLDGLGRVSHSKLTSDPAGTDTVDTAYDGLGRVNSFSNPYRATASSTDGTTKLIHDVLGRTTQIVHQDGSITQTDYSQYPLVTVIDPAGKARRNRADALGRLVEVDEPGDPSPGVPASTVLNIAGSGLQSKTTSIPATPGTGTLTISGTEQAKTNSAPTCKPTQPCGFAVGTLIYDSGLVSLTVNGHTDTVTFGQGSTVTDVANRLAAAIHASSPYVDYTKIVTNQTTLPNPPSATIYLQARTGGTNTDYSVSSSSTFDTSDFKSPSYATGASGATLTGGTDAPKIGIVTMDNGSVTVSVGNFTAHAPFGINANTTPSQLASALSNALNSQSPPFTATPGTASIAIKWNTIGQSPNGTPVSSSATWDSADFATSSFSVSGLAVSQGGDPYTSGLDHPYTTLYTYNGLDNLICIEQHGNATDGTGCDKPASSDATSSWRVRRFSFDSLSRMTSSSNPETNTIFDGTKYVRIPTNYSYDPDGNLLQQTSLAPNQTSSSPQTISYCYDELHRLIQKGYGNQSCKMTNPVVSYVYDIGTNAIGRLSSLTDQAGTASYGYDLAGRLQNETRSIAGKTQGASYTYNLDNSLQTLTYPSQRVLTYTRNGAGQVTAVTDQNGTQFVSNATYYPNGTELKRVMPSTTFNTYLNSRLQISGFYADNGQGTTVFADRTYNYGPQGGNNGNIMSITNNKDPNRSQTFTYDTLNRLTAGSSAANTGTWSWGETYSVDPWGNLQIAPMGNKAAGGQFGPAGNVQNQPAGLAYDAAGNMLSYLGNAYRYDEENRLSSAGGTSYVYDAHGQRASKADAISGAILKRYWHMAGNTLAESDSLGTLTTEYIYFGGKRIARMDVPNGTAHYYLSDHLGSTSLITNGQGTVEEESDFSPFGTEVTMTSNGVNEMKFTGKRRDTETQFDYFGARYYSKLFGRFVNADPMLFAADRAFDPQKLNLYSYANANPLRFVDPTGNATIPVELLARVNDLRQAAHQVAVSEVAAYRAGSGGTASYSARGSYLLQQASADQQNLEQHGDLQGLFDPQGQANYSLTELSFYLEPQVSAGVLNDLANWANDPSTSADEIKAAEFQILKADGAEVPEPNEGNRQLKEAAKSLFEKIADEGTDLLFEGASVVKKSVSFITEIGDRNHAQRQDALGSLEWLQEKKKPKQEPTGQTCIESEDGEKTWHPCGIQ